MSLSDPQIEELQAIHRAGLKVHVCEYLKVDWDPDDPAESRYYGNSQFRAVPPFTKIGVDVEPRLLGDPFRQLELYPDLRTDTIPVIFDDIDKAITQKFQTFGSGVRVEVFLYYPQVDGYHSLWFGQLQAPQVYGWKKVETVATNGFRSREQFLPKRLRPRECSWTFGGLQTAESLATNGCKYNRHVGGSIGNLKTGGVPYTDCPRDETACAARGMTAYYGGYKPDASAVVTDHNTGFLAVTKGNTSALRNPIRVIFGTKTVRANQLLFWRRELNQNDPDKGFVAGIWEICEGPIRSIRNIRVGEKLIEQMHLGVRLGTPAQAALTQYAPDIGRFSNVAHYFARKGWVNPLHENPQTLQSSCVVEGYAEVTQFNATAPGNGLLGQYYNNIGWTGPPAAQRIDPNVNFPLGYNAPVAGVGAENFTVRWTGTIRFPYSETFTIRALHGDGIKVLIDGVAVIDQLADTDPVEHTGAFAAAANTPYTIQIDFRQAKLGWACVLKWSSISQPEVVIPSSAFQHTGTTGVSRQWTNNRVWCLLEMMLNQRFGMSYPLVRFNKPSWIDGASWAGQQVTFSYTNSDGETRSFSHRRTSFDAVVEGRPVAEQIVDICRSGRLSVPFQKDGEFHIRPFRAFTDAELAAAKVFTDTGPSQNILWSQGADKAPMIRLSQTPDDKLVNEITLVFEDGSFEDNERPVTVDDPDQKLKAGRTLGENNLQSVPARFAAFGCRSLNEVVKLGYGLLRFGEFDEGGTMNNLTVQFEAPLVEALGVERHGPVKVASQLLDGFDLPGDGPVQYFRVRNIVKTSSDTVQITAQAYNHTASKNFETVQGVPAGTAPPWPPTYPPDIYLPNGEPGPITRKQLALIEAVEYDRANSILFVNLQ